MMIKREVSDGICVLTFDRPESGANIFDAATMNDLRAQIDEIEKDSSLKGVIVTSAKKSIFIAGADLQTLLRQAQTGEMRGFISEGQKVFNRLAALKIPTVAAIHGACAGGGYEITLACDYRIASNDPSTKIGLPETTLGLVPAWGGATRLPRLIGADAAAEVITKGKLYGADEALRPQQVSIRIAVGIFGRQIQGVDQPRRGAEQILGETRKQWLVQTRRICADTQRIGHKREACPRLFIFCDQPQQQPFLERAGEEKIADLGFVALSVAVDPAVALLQPVRIVGQVQMDQVKAALVQIQSFRQRIGADKHDPVLFGATFRRARSFGFGIGAADRQDTSPQSAPALSTAARWLSAYSV